MNAPRTQLGFYADGAGMPGTTGGAWAQPGQLPGQIIPETPDRQGGAWRNPDTNYKRETEGPRSGPTRASVVLRYIFYGFVILAASSVANWAFATGPGGRLAGVFMFFGAAIIIAGGAVSTWFYPYSRREIIAQVKHYAFGITLMPGVGIALLYRASQEWFVGPAANTSVFVSLTQNALPIVYFSTVVIPVIVFVGIQAGRRYLERSRESDGEAMSLWTRQDGLQR